MSSKDQPAPESPPKRCAKCGACTAVCPVYRASGNEIYSARGKRYLAEVYAGNQVGPVYEEIYSKCLLCGACATVCPQDLDITEDIVSARADFSAFYGEHGYEKFLARKALNRPELLGAARVLGRRAAKILFGRLPAGSGLRLKLAMFRDQPVLPPVEEMLLPRPLEVAGGETLLYFPGCTAHYLYPEIAREVEELLSGQGFQLTVPKGLVCCGMAFQAAGSLEEARRSARKNIRALELSEGPILVSCGSCFSQLARYHKLFEEEPDWQTRARLISERVVEISVFLESLLRDEPAPNGPGGGRKTRVFYHDPCHLRHDSGTTEEPRRVLRGLPGIELVELPDGPQCCGQGGLFHLGAPELSAAIRDDLAKKISTLKPDLITTTCSGCLMQLRAAMADVGKHIPVIHFAALVKKSRTR